MIASGAASSFAVNAALSLLALKAARTVGASAENRT